jgi:diphosphomevalonate decarboxylase
MRIEASAPSNIALIKYMGKTSQTSNLPSNASFSYTLEHLRSFVVIEPGTDKDEWKPLEGFQQIQLSETGLAKFLRHFDRLKTQWRIQGNYVIRSANNFPSDCGLASSASSFAALTLATARLAEKLKPELKLSVSELSKRSRGGSGSSCRSFFSPWALWRSEGAEPVDLNLQLDHAVIIVEDAVKSVSSSEAHKRVATSLLFKGRNERAEQRLAKLLEDLKHNRWREAFEICWAEFWDMHALFETSEPNFGYMRPGTLEVLNRLRGIWQTENDGPIVTLDAGANVHILIRQDQREKASEWLKGLQTISSWSAE